jgi:sugar lactone lactonase YvrE
VGSDNKVVTVVGFGQHDSKGLRQAPALTVGLGRPLGLAVEPVTHRLYWGDSEASRISRLNADGTAEVVAGALDGGSGDAGDGGNASEALLRAPSAIAFDAQGALFVADSGNSRVRKITNLASVHPHIESIAGLPTLQTLATLAAGNLPDATGPAKQALLVGPTALCFDPAGNLYVSEIGTAKLKSLLAASNGPALEGLTAVAPRIRKITPDGQIRPITGPGTGLLADPDSDDTLLLPFGLIIDPQGRLVIADAGNNQIKLLPKGTF